jgi:alkaline phosphatase D
MQLYRKLSFGQLAEFLVLDTRQYRTDQPNGDGGHDINDAAQSPQATLLGPRQRDWVEASLGNSPASWNVLAQQVMMGMVDLEPGSGRKFWMDQWPGYMHDRRRLLEFCQQRQVSNPIVLTGDYHANWVNNLRIDDRRTETPLVATEFVGTSISSEGDGVESPVDRPMIMAENPGVQFYNRERGYVRCTVTADAWRSDFRVVPYVTRPGAPISTRASFVVEAGQAGAQRLA